MGRALSKARPPARLAIACALSLALLVSGCGAKTTIIQGAGGGKDLPNNGFPTSVDVQGVKQTSDATGDWGFYNGESPGRTDGYVDIVNLWTGFTVLDDKAVQQLELEVPCGPIEEGPSVAFCPTPLRPLQPGGVLFISMELAAPAQQENTSPEDSGRYSVFFDFGDNPDTESTATPDAPDLASDGADFLYQLVYGQPGGAVEGTNPNAVELSAVDDTTDTFPPTGARVWVHGNFVTWVIPRGELTSHIFGVRSMAFWGDAEEQGNPALGGHDVAPGGVHAPYGFADLEEPIPDPQDDPLADLTDDEVLQLLEELEQHFRSGDGEQLFDALHPAVIERYGEDQCLDFTETLEDPTRSYKPLGAPKAQSWEYASDGELVTIDDAVTIPIKVTVNGETTETEIHLAPGAGGNPAWFTDCGTPVM